MSGRQGVLDLRIDETPVAVFDFETTGLSAGPDRVIEVSIVRLEPGRDPVLALDTLVRPNRPVAANAMPNMPLSRGFCVNQISMCFQLTDRQ